MTNFTCYIPTRIIFGAGTLNELHAQPLPGKKALIVTTTGQSIKRFGYLDRVEKQLRQAGLSSVLFDKILPNPVKKHVMEGAALAKTRGVTSSSVLAAAAASIQRNPSPSWRPTKAITGITLQAEPARHKCRKTNRCRLSPSRRPPERVRKPIPGQSSPKKKPMKKSVSVTTTRFRSCPSSILNSC